MVSVGAVHGYLVLQVKSKNYFAKRGRRAVTGPPPLPVLGRVHTRRGGRGLHMNATSYVLNASLGNFTVANTSGVTVTAADDVDAALLAACRLWQPAAFVYMFTLPVWIVMFAYWFLAVWHCHSTHALDLHRMLTWIPGIEMLHTMLSIIHFLACPWRRPIEKIFGAAWVIVSILKEPVMLVCLLLVAKGWCITRQRLSTNEVAHSAMLVTALYASVIVQMSVTRLVSLVPVLVATLMMLLYVVSSVVTNLRVLKAQLLVLRSFNVDATTTPAYLKFRMYRALAVYTTVVSAPHLHAPLTPPGNHPPRARSSCTRGT